MNGDSPLNGGALDFAITIKSIIAELSKGVVHFTNSGKRIDTELLWWWAETVTAIYKTFYKKTLQPTCIAQNPPIKKHL